MPCHFVFGLPLGRRRAFKLPTHLLTAADTLVAPFMRPTLHRQHAVLPAMSPLVTTVALALPVSPHSTAPSRAITASFQMTERTLCRLLLTAQA